MGRGAAGLRRCPRALGDQWLAAAGARRDDRRPAGHQDHRDGDQADGDAVNEEPHYQRVEREAAKRLTALLVKPLPKTPDHIGCQEFFDPWDLFPALYGSY